jgi:WD40 repeat protein
MSETKELLRRGVGEFEPMPDAYDRVLARRERKHRNQRVGAGVLGLAIAIAVGWLGVNAIRSSEPGPADDPTPLPTTPESWSRVRLDPPLAGGDAPSFLLAGPGGLVAVSSDHNEDGGPATAWTSTDGATWARTPAEDLDGGHPDDMRSGGPGFLATGSAAPEGDPEGEYERAIWTSEDGVSWNRLPDDPAFGDTLFISAVAPGGPGLVAVGSHLGAWYSTDGSTWERASVPPVPPQVYPGDDGETPQIYLTDVADLGSRLVSTGWAMLNDDSEVVVIWTSRDGRSWTDVPTPADVFPPGSSISQITAGPDGFVAVGRVGSSAAIWYSPDGRDWHLHGTGPDGLQLNSVAAGDAGYVAVGASMDCRTTCPSREAIVMTSVDGETWVVVPSGPAFRADQPRDPENALGAAMYEVVTWGSRFAALGEYDGEPTVWVTAPEVQEDVTTPPLPDLRPDGEVISNALAYGVDGDVFLAGADGSNAVKVADGAPVDECAEGQERAVYIAFGTAWSPDGGYVAFWDRGCPVSEGTYTALISDAEGNVIASFPGQGWQISWSPDSRRVAVMDRWAIEGQGDDATIGVYGLDGTRQAALTVPSALVPPGDYSPVWSRDGSSILLPGLQVPLDGEAPTPLPNDADRSWFGVYSPDGSRFAYVNRRSLVVADADEPDAQKMSGAWEFWDLAWSPNGELVAYDADDTELLVRDTATGVDTSLVDVTESERLNVVEFSPDGDRIFFTRSDADGSRISLWSISVDGSDLRRLVDRVDWADLRPQGRTS